MEKKGLQEPLLKPEHAKILAMGHQTLDNVNETNKELARQGEVIRDIHGNIIEVRAGVKTAKKKVEAIRDKKFYRIMTLYGIIALLAILIFIKIFRTVFFFL